MDNTINIESKIARNALSGMIASVIYLFSRIFLTPYILHYLSLAEFGLWSLSFIILSYAGLGGFGVNSTYIRYSARYLADGKEADISKLLSTGTAYMFSFGFIFCLSIYFLMPFILLKFNITDTQRNLASDIIFWTAIVFCLELAFGGILFIINGLHEFAKEKFITTFSGFVEILLIILFLRIGFGVKGLIYAFGLRIIISTVLCWYVARTLLPSLTISFKNITKEHFFLFVKFGGKVQSIGILGIFLGTADRMFINAIAGLSSGGMFELGRKFPSTAAGIASSAFAPFLSTAAHFEGSWSIHDDNTPKNRVINYITIGLTTAFFAIIPLFFLPSVYIYFSFLPIVAVVPISAICILLFFHLHNKQKQNNYLKNPELKFLYLDGIRFTNIISSTLFSCLIALAYPLINAWVGIKYLDAANIMIFLSIGYALQLCTGPINMIYRGMDRTGKELEYTIVQLILMIIWTPAATVSFGLAGTAAATTFSSLISTLFLFWRSSHIFQIKTSEFITRSIIPSTIPFVPAYCIYTIVTLFQAKERLDLIIQILACGIGYLLVSSLLFWFTILNDKEKIHALQLLRFKR